MPGLERRGASADELGEFLRRLERPIHDHEIARAKFVQLLRRARTGLARADQQAPRILQIPETLVSGDGRFRADRVAAGRERRLGLHALARTECGLEQTMQHGAGGMAARRPLIRRLQLPEDLAVAKHL